MEDLLDLGFQQAAFFLHHHDEFQAPAEVADAGGFQGPRHRHLVKGQRLVVQLQILQGLAHIQIGLAGGDHPYPGIAGPPQRPVQLVGPAKGPYRRDFLFVEATLLLQRSAGPADIQSPRGQREVIGQDDPGGSSQVHRGGGLHGVVDAFQGAPAAAVTGQRKADQAVFEDFLYARRV